MLKQIIIKELKNNLVSLRFLLILTLVLILFGVSTFVFTGIFHKKLTGFNELVNKNNQDLNTWSENLSTLSRQEQTILISPTPMEIVSEGGIKNLPNSFKVHAFQIMEPENISAHNKYMRKFNNVDWGFIISFILSFFAILLTYDAFSGEKSDGTLSLLLSNSVRRTTVILGKYFSALITIAIPLFIGITISLLILTLYGQTGFSALQFGKIFIFVTAAFAYLSIFVLLGLLVTSLTKNSVTSIIILLFIWVLLAVLIPNSGGKIAAKIYSIPTREEIDRQISDRREEIHDARNAEYPATFRWSSSEPRGEWVPYRARAVNEMGEARNNIELNYMNQRIDQIKKSRKTMFVSPTAVFNDLSEKICTTGIDKFENFYNQIVQYRQSFRQFIIDKDKMDEESFHCVYEWEASPMSQKPVDYQSIPRFEERELTVSTTLKKALFNFSLLLIFNIVLFIFVFTAFLKYDVR